MNVGFITRPQTAGIHVDDGGSLSDRTTMYHGLVTYSNSRWMMQNLEGKLVKQMTIDQKCSSYHYIGAEFPTCNWINLW